MASSRELLRDLAVGTLVGGGVVAAMFLEGTPRWLRGVATGVAALAMLAPLLPVLVLLPWHFLAVRRGLMPRGTTGYGIAIDGDAIEVLHVTRGGRYSVSDVARVRIARNGNWTDSKMLEDALAMLDPRGRRIVRVPLSSPGASNVVVELQRRGVPIDEVEVSAPTFLD